MSIEMVYYKFFSDKNKANTIQLGSFSILCVNKFEGNLFKNELDKLCKEHKTRIAFECIGGKTTGLVLNSLYEKGKLFHYWNLSLREITNLSTYDFIFQENSIKYIELYEYEYVNNSFHKV